ncbi:hypothetical protein IJ182_10570 [bacterium]|nr:hypothetical protein [bacterium]
MGSQLVQKYIKYPNIEYVMPFLFNNDIFIPILNELLKDEINPIKYVYGSIQSAWAGGRPAVLPISRLTTIDKYLSKFAKYNITPVLTWTNRNLDNDILNDEFSNELLDIVVKNNCNIIIASDKLYTHIKSRYKNAKLVASVIAPSILHFSSDFDETKYYNQMLEKYEVVVVRPEWTINNIDNIDKLLTAPNRIEVLINQVCVPNCPYAKEHYELIEKAVTNKISQEELNSKWTNFCPREKVERNENVPDNIQTHSLFFDDNIMNKLITQGVTKYKVQGRGNSFDEIAKTLHAFLFNNNYSLEEITNVLYKICTNLVINNKFSALTYL